MPHVLACLSRVSSPLAAVLAGGIVATANPHGSTMNMHMHMVPYILLYRSLYPFICSEVLMNGYNQR